MTEFNDITHVLWDLDGTLVDSYGIYSQILAEAAELSGLSMPDEQKLLYNFHGSLDESIKNALDLVDGEDFATLFNDFLRIQENYYKQPETHLFVDAANLVQRFSGMGVQQTVVTNREHAGRGNASPRYLVEHSSLKDCIGEVISGDSGSYKKPDVRVLETVPVLNDVPAERLLVIGDQFVDAMLAKNIGCTAVLVNRSNEPIAHLGELGDDLEFLTVVASLDEIKV